MVAAIEALAEPQRRRILDALVDGERVVGDLATELGLAQPSVSKHLRVLKESGLVRVRAEAQRRWYRVDVGPLVELDAWLEPYRRIWSDRLDALERRLDEMDDPEEP
ncbi:MAG: winged helix-turn-helix transcriptional regulator [Acidimicrobiales bacterium]|nr:winged helix-turn-helix transcriptional regulator [Acidimicrobiales bacterium]